MKSKFFRTSIENLDAYVPGLQPKGKGFIKLNTNENPYPPSPRVIDILQQTASDILRLYPSPTAGLLREKIAQTFGFKKEWVFVGNGSDEILNLIVRACLGKGDKLWVTDPTYILYEVLANMQEARVIKCPLGEDFQWPKRFDLQGAKLVMISNPNTPTGTFFAKTQISEVCKKTKGLVVIDEAYADFAQTNCLDFVKKFKNVMITRTLSKSFSLAGLRVGFAVARPEVIQVLMKLKDSYNVNRLSQEAGLAAIEDLNAMKEAVKRVVRDREFLTQRLCGLGFQVIPSQANFIFVKHQHLPALKIYQGLYQRRILVRHLNLPRLKSYLRISIGTHQQMIQLVKELEKICSNARSL